MPPQVKARLERRILVNYRVDPDVLAAVLPAPFRMRDIDTTWSALPPLPASDAIRHRDPWPRYLLTPADATRGRG